MNITLIGMPGSGKSTIGVLLAKRLGMEFVDTDLLIQKREKRRLPEIIAREGIDRFLEIENEVNASLEVENTIIAPGGSAVYGREAMEHFREISKVVYLKLSLRELKKRLGDLKSRGVVCKEGETLADVMRERAPLYEQYADLIVVEKQYDVGPTVDELRAHFEPILKKLSMEDAPENGTER